MRVALTGGAAGIGAAVAEKMKAQGAHVTAFDLNQPVDFVDEWIKLDLSDPQSIRDAAATAQGPFDALINNAGLPPRPGSAEQVLRVNYFGLRDFMMAMLDKLHSGASIVNTASRAGAMWLENIEQVKQLMALPSADDLAEFLSNQKIDHVRSYNLSKEAVIVLTQTMTEALIARGLRINSVSPAAVSTGILEDFKTAFGERVAHAILRAGRAGDPDEVADVICFLASPQSRWIKGQNLTIDGGISAMVMADEINSTIKL